MSDDESDSRSRLSDSSTDKESNDKDEIQLSSDISSASEHSDGGEGDEDGEEERSSDSDEDPDFAILRAASGEKDRARSVLMELKKQAIEEAEHESIASSTGPPPDVFSSSGQAFGSGVGLWTNSGKSKVVLDVISNEAIAFNMVTKAFGLGMSAVNQIVNDKVYRERIVKHILAASQSREWVIKNSPTLCKLLGLEPKAIGDPNEFILFLKDIKTVLPHFLSEGLGASPPLSMDKDSSLKLVPGSFDGLNRMFWVWEYVIGDRLSGRHKSADLKAALANYQETPPVHPHLQTFLNGEPMSALPFHYQWRLGSQPSTIADEWLSRMGFH